MRCYTGKLPFAVEVKTPTFGREAQQAHAVGQTAFDQATRLIEPAEQAHVTGVEHGWHVRNPRLLRVVARVIDLGP